MAKWTLFAHNGLEYGPLDEKELSSWIRERRVSVDDLVRLDNSGQWEIVGEVDTFTAYFKDSPTQAGRIKKALKNELSVGCIKNKLPGANTEPSAGPVRNEISNGMQGSNRANCGECSFIKAVERLHEEKKILEEKLAEERARR